jgi:hypothetical protein
MATTLNISAFCALLIAFIVSVSTKPPEFADNAPQARSSVSEMNMKSSVVNDNICNNHEKNVVFDVMVFDNSLPVQLHDESVGKRVPRDSRRASSDRPRSDQKSLLIVFDATGSMHDDLEQLRDGAQEIINELSERGDYTIFNYVLTVFRDPSKCCLSALVFCFVRGQPQSLSAPIINLN